jgi:hypothetical protein
MSVLRILATGGVMSCFALSAMAQTGPGEGKGGSYHYSGGPKSEVPYHAGEKKPLVKRKPARAGATITMGVPNPKCPIT